MVGERQHGKLSKKKVEAEEEEIYMWDIVWVHGQTKRTVQTSVQNIGVRVWLKSKECESHKFHQKYSSSITCG